MMLDIVILGGLVLLLDSIFLYMISTYFNHQIRIIQKHDIKVKILGAILCYLLIIAGLKYYIVNKNASYLEAFLLGIICYGIYETTNYALFTKWRFKTVIIDSIWGGILFATSYYLFKNRPKFLKS